MKTAVDWLVDRLYLVIPNEERNFLEGLRKEALEKEKEQIIDAWNKRGSTIVPRYFLEENINGEEYYNQKYNQNK